MHTTVKFAKLRNTAIIPSKRLEDAGYDIYANFEEPYMTIKPHETKMIPTGIASACDIDYCLILKERGSTGSRGIAQRCGVIDSGYRGEIFVPITNTTDNTILICKQGSLPETISVNTIIYPYEKAIAQLLLIPVPTADIEEYTYEDLLAIPSIRGTGMCVSSDK